MDVCERKCVDFRLGAFHILKHLFPVKSSGPDPWSSAWARDEGGRKSPSLPGDLVSFPGPGHVLLYRFGLFLRSVRFGSGV